MLGLLYSLNKFGDILGKTKLELCNTIWVLNRGNIMIKILRNIAPVLLSILAIQIIDGCGKSSDGQQNRGGGGGKGVSPVEAIQIKPQLLQNKIFASGSLMANEEVELRSEISGRVVGVFFEEGKKVQKGELLLKINDTELQAQLKRKSFEIQQASDNEKRQRSLLDIKGISQEDYDRYLNSLKMIQAEKEVIQTQIDKTNIRAPFDGVIGLRYVSEGGFVTPDVLIATMQDIDPIKVEFSVPEKYVDHLKTGINVSIQTGDSQASRDGLIYAVESKIDPLTRTIKARAKISNPEGNLIPGSYAKVEIILSELADAIVIPSGAVIPQMNGDIAYLYKGGKAKSVAVKTGIRTDASIQIVEGISANDTLITSGLLQLTNDKDVKITALKSR
jgi:membrane fusion protein, multidrug efflux system